MNNILKHLSNTLNYGLINPWFKQRKCQQHNLHIGLLYCGISRSLLDIQSIFCISSESLSKVYIRRIVMYLHTCFRRLAQDSRVNHAIYLLIYSIKLYTKWLYHQFYAMHLCQLFHSYIVCSTLCEMKVRPIPLESSIVTYHIDVNADQPTRRLISVSMNWGQPR